MVLIELAGRRFGRLVVLSRSANTPGKSARWLCRCDCGAEKVIASISLRRGYTKSCGCLNREVIRAAKTRLKHGGYLRPEYWIWHGMRARCLNPRSPDYPRYGGRGITVDPRWNDFAVFFADMGPRPSPDLSLDRIDTNGPYSRENCRWATRSQQQRNKRPNTEVRRGNRWLEHGGERMVQVEWAARIGITPSCLNLRLKRMDIGRAIAMGPSRRERSTFR